MAHEPVSSAVGRHGARADEVGGRVARRRVEWQLGHKRVIWVRSLGRRSASSSLRKLSNFYQFYNRPTEVSLADRSLSVSCSARLQSLRGRVHYQMIVRSVDPN
jgi:hypothetical protein